MKIELTAVQVAVVQVAMARIECARDFISVDRNETALAQPDSAMQELRTQLPGLFLKQEG